MGQYQIVNILESSECSCGWLLYCSRVSKTRSSCRIKVVEGTKAGTKAVVDKLARNTSDTAVLDEGNATEEMLASVDNSDDDNNITDMTDMLKPLASKEKEPLP